MSSPSYNSSSLGWQIHKGAQRFREWAEYRADQSDFDWPDWKWPDWARFDWRLPPEVGQILFWSGVSLVAVWLGWLLFRAIEPSFARWLEQEQSWVKLGKQAAPSTGDRAAKDWWKQAQDFAQQGRYADACKALYSATLQHLHDSQQLLHKPSRTDGEYLEQLRQHEQPGQKRPLPRPYQLLIGTHERLVFGSAIATAEMFQRCRQAYEEIRK